MREKRSLLFLLTSAVVISSSVIGVGEVEASQPNPESDFEYTVDTLSAEVTITAYKGTSTEVVIPDTIGGYPVTVIGVEAFKPAKFGGKSTVQLTKVQFPEYLRVIRSSAFEGNLLTKVHFRHGLQVISGVAFENNKLEGEILIPSTVITVGPDAFKRNNITEAVLYNKSTIISVGANTDSFPGNNVNYYIVKGGMLENNLRGNNRNYFDIEPKTVVRFLEDRPTSVKIGVSYKRLYGNVKTYKLAGDYTSNTSTFNSIATQIPSDEFFVSKRNLITFRSVDEYGYEVYTLIDPNNLYDRNTKSENKIEIAVESGILDVTHDPITSFGKVKLTEENTALSVDIPNLKVSDYRGTGAGWRLTASATPFSLENSDYTLPTGSLVVGNYSIGTSNASLPDTSESRVVDGNSVVLGFAEEEKGMGTTEFLFDSNSALKLVTNSITAKPGNYHSTLNINLTSGPGGQ